MSNNHYKGNTMSGCKGKNCEAINGVSHSYECKLEHDKCVDTKKKPPSCFDRAEHAGRVFDNCRFYQECKDSKRICGNYPVQDA